MLHHDPKRRHCLETTAALAALSVLGSANVQAHDTRVLDETWHDTARSRALPMRIRVPGTPGPWPVVVYSHGLGGSREGGDAWGQAWCQAGIMVLHVQHPGSDGDVFRQGMQALRAAASAEQLRSRVADVRFVLDELARRQRSGTAPWPHARLDAIGMAGHSFGARTTQALAGERFPVATPLAEPRFQAFMAFSPSSHASRPVREAFGAVQRPFFAITGSHDGDPFGAFASGESRARVFEGLPSGQRALLWLDGADHSSFAGNVEQRIAGRGLLQREPVALSRETAHHALVARLSTLWWRWRLAGDAAAWESGKTQAGLTRGDRLELG